MTFACRGYYHFAFFGLIPTFLLMTLITAVAFLLSVRLNAIVVAVLGIAGGFLTPILLSTNQDNPLGLFGYIALLDIGLLALAQRQRWNALPILGAIGTALMQFAWVERVLCSGEIFRRQQSPHLHGGVCWVSGAVPGRDRMGKAHRKSEHDTFRMRDRSRGGRDVLGVLPAWFPASRASAGAVVHLSVRHRPWLAGTNADRKKALDCSSLAGLAAFIFLGAWTGNYLTIGHIYTALGFYFVFALFHAAVPIALQRLHKIEVPRWTHIFPALALLLVLIPIFRLTELSLLVWPFVLIIDVLAIGAGDSDCDSAARHRRARAHTGRDRRVAAANSD